MSTSSSPAPFDFSSTHASSVPPTSTAASSPPPDELDDADAEPDAELEARYKRLSFVLEKSAMYSTVLKAQMDSAKERHRAAMRERAAAPRPAKRARRTSKTIEDEQGDADDDGDGDGAAFPQPALVTGARLKDYQLEGLQWMVSLHENGISGILADEMGLGKTLQTIAFSAHLRELGFGKPFLVVCPLSVLHNWVEEYRRFAPEIPVVMYHGTPAERAELRRTVLRWPPAPSSSTKSKSTKRKRGAEAAPAPTFPIVLTTYELAIRDRPVLATLPWGYIVVDEGHRLKNFGCRLMQELKRYGEGGNAGRMVLTGTPLHNNLAELWSLLHFILPDIFDDVDAFQEWFNLPQMQTLLPSARMGTFISAMHAILKPFLLRRLKSDVLTGSSELPPKKSYVLYARLCPVQRAAYEAVVRGGVRGWVVGAVGVGASMSASTSKEDEKGKEVEEEEAVSRRTRNSKSKAKTKGKGKGRAKQDEEDEAQEAEDEARRREAEAFRMRGAVKHVNNMRLQNTVMQLRKVCSHPFLFARPGELGVDWAAGTDVAASGNSASEGGEGQDDADVVRASGKMMLLERLLGELFARGHKVLLFSQFTSMLDIIEDWAVDTKGWRICRIDGTTAPLERRDQMHAFQSAGDAPDAPQLFLLSTRAGGLGVNLTAADTVIFYDQDWNPQMDAQAQDRAHRIGQTKPVLIFRLVTASTIEEKIMQRATEKRKLEALVIAKGKFKMPATAAGAGGSTGTLAEMAAALLRLENEQDRVGAGAEGQGMLSDTDLALLLDRSPAVFADRGRGWGEGAAVGETKFAVYEAPVDVGNDALAGMMGEDAEC